MQTRIFTIDEYGLEYHAIAKQQGNSEGALDAKGMNLLCIKFYVGNSGTKLLHRLMEEAKRA